MTKSNKFSPEVRERAVRMVQVSIRYTERLDQAGIRLSVGSRGDWS